MQGKDLDYCFQSLLGKRVDQITWTSIGCSLITEADAGGALFLGGRFDELFPFLEAEGSCTTDL